MVRWASRAPWCLPPRSPASPDTHGGSLVARPDYHAIGGGTGQGGRALRLSRRTPSVQYGTLTFVLVSLTHPPGTFSAAPK